MRLMSRSAWDPALHAFHSIERNLKRERRVFSMVIILLIIGAFAAAVVTIAGRLADSLDQEERATRLAIQNLAHELQERNNLLTTVSVIIALRASGVLLPETPHHADDKCVAGVPMQGPRSILMSSCAAAAQLFLAAGSKLNFELILTDGHAIYGHAFQPQPSRAYNSLSKGRAREVVDAVLEKYRSLALDPLIAAREKRIVWLRSPKTTGSDLSRMIGASLVLKDGALYAMVVTTLDLKDVLQPGTDDTSISDPVVVTNSGTVAIGHVTPEQAAEIDTRTGASTLQYGHFHWIPSDGWVMRRPAPMFGFGHILRIVPLRQQIVEMRCGLILVLSTTVALVILLLAMFRYWNYQFLTRTYAEAARALESELLNHLLVHATPVGLCIVRKDGSEIVLANKIARDVLRIANTNMKLPAALSREFQKQGIDNTSFSLAEGAKIFQFSFPIEREGLNSLHLEITYAPAILNREDVLFCAIADTTQHVLAEQALREAKRTTEVAAKAKVSFFASMSHEIRTPLASLVGNIELLKLGPLVPEQEARLHAMQISAAGLLHVVNDVLDFSKIDVGELRLNKTWGSVTDLIGRIVLSHAHLAVRQGLKFYVVLDRAVPSRLLFDPIRVSQIVTNLLSNAFKFTQSGKIVVRVQWIDSSLAISIADSGIGIPDELKTQLFQPFMQGDSNRLGQARGTGLGLSITARLCELMGGFVMMESTVGVGTRVAVTLPLRSMDGTPNGADWTLQNYNPAIICHANEYREWLTNLFDPEAATVTVFTDTRHAVNHGRYDYLLVADEFDPADVIRWWGNPASIVWVGQDGPLVPIPSDNGGVAVSVYSLSGIRTATQMLESAVLDRTLTKKAKEAGPARRNFEKLTVLIAEDNLLNRGLLRDQLSTLGANVIEAVNGSEALSMLSKRSVDIVLTDIDMPVLNGFQLIDAVRNKSVSTPIYAVSASAHPDDIAEGRARGFSDYLTKPVSLSILTRVLDAAANPDGRDALTDAKAVVPRLPAVPTDYSAAFVEQTNLDVAKLDSVVKAQSVAQLRRWAHGVAGGLSVLGPSLLLQRCQDLRATISKTEVWTADIERQALTIADALVEMRSSGEHYCKLSVLPCG
ncbi:two-component system capsular synthesis sensor histidine kinase RcsC [Paraburkholderia sp. RAU2J]|nr:two-component system capsular synthesis sensor histidine kinase RcsC [Paraburkholderia sp. RAU2J]